RAIHADHLIEPIGIAAFLRYEEDRRALVRDESLSVDEEFVALGLTAEDGVVVDDEATAALVFLKEDRGGESTDSAANGDEIVHLAGVDGTGDTRFER